MSSWVHRDSADWVPGFREIAKPLYEATGGGQESTLNWTLEVDKAVHRLKEALLEAPALALPDIYKPFHVYVTKA